MPDKRTLQYLRFGARGVSARLIVFSLSLLLSGALSPVSADIYTYRQPDGTIRFTDKKPPSNVKFEVFTGKGRSYSTYQGTERTRTPKIHYRGEYDKIVSAAARQFSLDPHLILAVIHAESGFNPSAVSDKGARGLMQLMPGTARDMGVTNSFDPRQNILGGSKYLSQLLQRFGRIPLALAAYNAGEQNVVQYGGIPPFAETTNYVRRVIALHQGYRTSYRK